MFASITYPAWIRITKVQERPDALIPHNIVEGQSWHGLALKAPRCGQRFLMLLNFPNTRPGFYTSEVRELLSPWLFMTYNSFYLIEEEEAPAEAEELVIEAESVS
jgi:hypothetical protein